MKRMRGEAFAYLTKLQLQIEKDCGKVCTVLSQTVNKGVFRRRECSVRGVAANSPKGSPFF